jgi:hypothetical protein
MVKGTLVALVARLLEMKSVANFVQSNVVVQADCVFLGNRRQGNVNALAVLVDGDSTVDWRYGTWTGGRSW